MTNEKEKHVVGGEINSTCMKCGKPLAHTIMAMVGKRVSKVQCKTCDGLSAYFKPTAGGKLSRKRSAKISPEETWEKMVELVSSQKKIPYKLSGEFQEKDLIDHPTFGLGVVTLLMPDDKIQVVFKDEMKILVARR
jgi:hypothetical protein